MEEKLLYVGDTSFRPNYSNTHRIYGLQEIIVETTTKKEKEIYKIKALANLSNSVK